MASTSGYSTPLPTKAQAILPSSSSSSAALPGTLMAVQTPGGVHQVASATFIFNSQCEHHMLPFYGRVLVAYIPAAQGGLLSNSALEQVVQVRRSLG